MGRKNTSKYQGKFKTNQSFGEYKILTGEIIIENEAKVMCECSCGNIRLVSCYTLIKGTSTKCLECGNSLKQNQNPAWRGCKNIPGKVISKIKRDAHKRNIEYNITDEYLDEIFIGQNGKCALTNVKLNTTLKNLTLSLDRVDSKKGYIEGNVQWVHKDINMMKRSYTQEYFINLCQLVVNNIK